MEYVVREGNINNIVSSEVVVKDFSYLTMGNKFIMKKILTDDVVMKNIRFPDSIINAAVDIIISDDDIDKMQEVLMSVGLPLYSLISISTYKDKYEEFKKFLSCDSLVIVCDKDNLIRGLEFAKKINKSVIIDGSSISLKEYEYILSNYDIDSLKGKDIKINYQEQGLLIDIFELYNMAMIVNEISMDILENDLSPLERIIYVYDIVKERVYKECNYDKYNARDLNLVIQSNYIACVGYSNLFMAVLKNLGINTMPLISEKTKHQRSLVYINDRKYGINGAYVFDVTFDCKNDNKYINNYNYFAFKLEESEKDGPSNLSDVINMSFDDLLSLYSENISVMIKRINNIREKEYLLKKVFAFVNESDYDALEQYLRAYRFADSIQRNYALKLYNSFKNKYNPKDISSGVLLQAIYNVRKLQYDRGMVHYVLTDEIVAAIKNRYLAMSVRTFNEEGELERFYNSIDGITRLQREFDREMSENVPLINFGVSSKILKKTE